jgi:hypothetical protein
VAAGCLAYYYCVAFAGGSASADAGDVVAWLFLCRVGCQVASHWLVAIEKCAFSVYAGAVRGGIDAVYPFLYVIS